MQRLKELTVYAANGTLTPEDRSMIRPEVEELFHHLVSIGNTEVGGLYIFGGHQTQKPPYEIDPNNPDDLDDAYKGDGGQREIEITPSQTLPINLTGREAFGDSGTELFQTVCKLANALSDDNVEALGKIFFRGDARLDYLLQQRAEIGARMERLWSTEQRLQSEHIHLRELRSKIEDLDLAEAITEFTMQKNAYMAALATGAQMIYPSLVDFLR